MQSLGKSRVDLGVSPLYYGDIRQGFIHLHSILQQTHNRGLNNPFTLNTVGSPFNGKHVYYVGESIVIMVKNMCALYYLISDSEVGH